SRRATPFHPARCRPCSSRCATPRFPRTTYTGAQRSCSSLGTRLIAASADADRAAVHVVCGPTAAGKSEVAMWLAERAACALISADSRQIYRGFDVGTAKPSPADRSSAPHYGIDVAEPTERYSAAAWAEAADGWISGARAGGRTQLVRAIEIALLAGERVSDLHRRNARPSRWRPRYLLVDPGPALQPRIAARLDHMLDHGWPDEVRRLMHTVSADAPAWNASGYGAVRDWMAGGSTRDAARERVLIETRQYAKRQRTWFRHQ